MLYIVSFPRSGNTFLRYCIEQLTGRITLGCFNSPPDTPIFQRDGVEGMNVNENAEGIARKAHKWYRINDKLSNQDNLILILRDYKECLLRHSKKNETVDDIINNYTDNYFNLIEKYDQFKGSKFQIYYENLIDDNQIKSILMDLKDFLCLNGGMSIRKEDIDSFVENVDWHRHNSLKSYSHRSVTKGNKKKYHQRNLSENDRVKLDNYFQDKNLSLYNKYLIN